MKVISQLRVFIINLGETDLIAGLEDDKLLRDNEY